MKKRPTVMNTKPTAADAFSSRRLGVCKQLSNRLFLTVDVGLCTLTGGTTSADLGQTLGVSLDYRFRRGVHGSVSSAPSTVQAVSFGGKSS